MDWTLPSAYLDYWTEKGEKEMTVNFPEIEKEIQNWA
jgi:hypothetical protein